MLQCCSVMQCQARGQVWSQYRGCLWLPGLQSLQRYNQELITKSVIIRAAENIFLKTCCWWHSAVTWKMGPSPARAPRGSLAPAIIALPFLFFHRTTTNCSLYWMQPPAFAHTQHSTAPDCRLEISLKKNFGPVLDAWYKINVWKSARSPSLWYLNCEPITEAAAPVGATE